MSAKFERSIADWYSHSRTANLEYLNLESSSKPSISHLSHNIDVVYDRLSLHSKVCIKENHQILDLLSDIKNSQDLFSRKIQKDLQNLKALVEDQKPLTKTEVFKLVSEISQQPKIVEEEALRLTANLEQQVQKIEHLIKEVKHLITG